MVICISYADQENPKVFEWLEEADAGYGDQLITGPGDVFLQLAPHEAIKILRKQFPDLCARIAGSHMPSKRDTKWRPLCDEVYTALKSLCLPLALYQPTEQEEYIMADVKKPAPAPAAANKAAPAAKEAKEKKAPAPRKWGPNDTIHFAADKSGKKYGPDHNPKRVGSASHKLWGVYKEGMRVEDYVKAGGNSGAISWDTEHGFITVKKAAA